MSTIYLLVFICCSCLEVGSINYSTVCMMFLFVYLRRYGVFREADALVICDFPCLQERVLYVHRHHVYFAVDCRTVVM